ncbi:hypothetical protein [Pseudoalteromonas sp. SK20]|uniref:hypothetical protein n=1 Tax=Pseudoalteromonas sp. SK20 TaxID=1938367 RepID=UPI00097640F8|nr:hypothetical protein [Pseudoalteromonas sp. SK20]
MSIGNEDSSSGYAITFVEVIAANVCGEAISSHELQSLEHSVGTMHCAVENGEKSTHAELKVLDLLLTENNPSLAGVIFTVYNEANNFLEPIFESECSRLPRKTI